MGAFGDGFRAGYKRGHSEAIEKARRDLRAGADFLRAETHPSLVDAALHRELEHREDQRHEPDGDSSADALVMVRASMSTDGSKPALFGPMPRSSGQRLADDLAGRYQRVDLELL